MSELDNQNIEPVTEANDENLVTELYQKVERLSLPAKAALAQHLISTNELTVVASRRVTVDDAIQNMNRIALGHTLDAIANQIRQLDRSSLDLEQ